MRVDPLSDVHGDTPPGGENHRLDRRRFLQGLAGLSLSATNLGVLAGCQSHTAGRASNRLPRLGCLFGGNPQFGQPNMAAFIDGLDALGYREGQTIRIEWRHVDSPARGAAAAKELVDLRPDVIVVVSLPFARSVVALTQSIPIVAIMPLVFGAEELIQRGYIKSQAHPGSNFTGLIGSTPTLPGKRLDLLHETLPAATRLAVLRDSSDTDRYVPYPEWASQVSSQAVSGSGELAGAFARFEAEHAELLAVGSGRGRISGYLDQIAEQASQLRLPAIGDLEDFASVGGLMTYAADQLALFRAAGRFVDKILKGASPADLPVELPTVFRFVINQKTASALDVTIPPAVLAQATEVLQ